MEQIEEKRTTRDERLRMMRDYWVEKNHSTTKAFERLCGISNSYFHRRELDGKPADEKKLSPMDRALEKMPEINPMWAYTGKGSMFVNDPEEVDSPKKGAPYYDVDFLGGFDLVASDETIKPDSYFSMKDLNKDGLFWCNITGNSMAPLIRSGSRICMKEVNKYNLLYGDIYALVIRGDDPYDLLRTVKYVNRSDIKGCVRLVPENANQKYGDYQDVKVDNILHVFKIIAFFTIL